VEKMKAQIESSGSNAYLGGVRGNGKVHKAKNFGSKQKKEENSEEIKAYLNKLQEIVPFMPKNKRLSKVEVISNVIDYIRDLRETLGMPNFQEDSYDGDDSVIMTEDCNATTTTVTLTLINSGNVALPSINSHSVNSRQPLGVISSNPSSEIVLSQEVSEK